MISAPHYSHNTQTTHWNLPNEPEDSSSKCNTNINIYIYTRTLGLVEGGLIVYIPEFTITREHQNSLHSTNSLGQPCLFNNPPLFICACMGSYSLVLMFSLYYHE